MSHFSIKCRKCGKVLENTYCAFCEHCKDALLITQYADRQFATDRGEGICQSGDIWRFNWLPVHRPGFGQPGPVVYLSTGLAGRLGIEELYISFSGYWPEKGALLKTCTFKEFEAAMVIQNAVENQMEGLVVASAGNTARAFAHLAKVSGFRAVIVVPSMCLPDMWYLEERAVPTIAISDGDYSDSIATAKRIALVSGMPFEGGVKNIAKRDGLGVVLLEAADVMKKLPRHYFQAVGSGAGAIAVWEMAERLLADGRFGSSLPVLHLAQNLPFAPMAKAYWKKSREISPADISFSLVGETTTRVLTNRYPAYGVLGGVFDALEATGGAMYGVANEEVYAAMELFKDAEGTDIVPAAGVAVAALIQAVKYKNIGKDGPVLLNITGGGEAVLRSERPVYRVSPSIISKDIHEKEIEDLLCETLKKS
ncbi:MAG: cysteate synthase [Actinomycetota bacterium]|nr:cysteate synthase [Actinomycetota bacterium]